MSVEVGATDHTQSDGGYACSSHLLTVQIAEQEPGNGLADHAQMGCCHNLQLSMWLLPLLPEQKVHGTYLLFANIWNSPWTDSEHVEFRFRISSGPSSV